MSMQLRKVASFKIIRIYFAMSYKLCTVERTSKGFHFERGTKPDGGISNIRLLAKIYQYILQTQRGKLNIPNHAEIACVHIQLWKTSTCNPTMVASDE